MTNPTIEWVQGLVERSLHAARTQPEDPTICLGHLHSARSCAFVDALAAELLSSYAHDPDVRVLYRRDGSNKAEFGLNELLYDVTVVSSAVVLSAVRRQPFRYVSEPLWLIESELDRRSNQVLFDFNKLILGAAVNKLIVARQSPHQVALIEMLREPARGCKGNVFVALIPHPEDWQSAPSSVPVWRLS